jgi:branched-chain amino acid transport system permease protein
MNVAGVRGQGAWLAGLFVVVMAIVPWIVPSYTAFELTYAGAYVIAIIGLVILIGTCGQISLGHGAFVAIGGYTVAILAQHFGFPVWASIAIGALICGVFGIALGLIALRLEGVYMALATFALAVAVPSILKRFKGVTGGVGGITLNPVSVPAPLHSLFTPERWTYYWTWGLLAVLFVATWYLLQGRIGRSFRALRDDENAAVAFGVNPQIYKSLAFAWSAAYAGIAGGILAVATAYVSPDTYGFTLSLTLVIGAVLGGLDLLWGAVLGGILIEFLPLWTQKINSAAPSVVYGIALIAVMIVLPGGIAGAIRHLFHKTATRTP